MTDAPPPRKGQARVPPRDVRLEAARRELARLEARLRVVRSCMDPRCVLCTACLAAVRDA